MKLMSNKYIPNKTPLNFVTALFRFLFLSNLIYSSLKRYQITKNFEENSTNGENFNNHSILLNLKKINYFCIDKKIMEKKKNKKEDYLDRLVSPDNISVSDIIERKNEILESIMDQDDLLEAFVERLIPKAEKTIVKELNYTLELIINKKFDEFLQEQLVLGNIKAKDVPPVTKEEAHPVSKEEAMLNIEYEIADFIAVRDNVKKEINSLKIILISEKQALSKILEEIKKYTDETEKAKTEKDRVLEEFNTLKKSLDNLEKDLDKGSELLISQKKKVKLLNNQLEKSKKTLFTFNLDKIRFKRAQKTQLEKFKQNKNHLNKIVKFTAEENSKVLLRAKELEFQASELVRKSEQIKEDAKNQLALEKKIFLSEIQAEKEKQTINNKIYLEKQTDLIKEAYKKKFMKTALSLELESIAKLIEKCNQIDERLKDKERALELEVETLHYLEKAKIEAREINKQQRLVIKDELTKLEAESKLVENMLEEYSKKGEFDSDLDIKFDEEEDKGRYR